ncbi:MAG: hypothetical protein LM573_09055 [Thermofilum sp.]|nr:hypothetical protein [Thermofilum sp.]
MALGEKGTIIAHLSGKTYIKDFYSKKLGGKVLRRSKFYEKSGFQQ